MRVGSHEHVDAVDPQVGTAFEHKRVDQPVAAPDVEDRILFGNQVGQLLRQHLHAARMHEFRVRRCLAGAMAIVAPMFVDALTSWLSTSPLSPALN